MFGRRRARKALEAYLTELERLIGSLRGKKDLSWEELGRLHGTAWDRTWAQHRRILKTAPALPMPDYLPSVQGGHRTTVSLVCARTLAEAAGADPDEWDDYWAIVLSRTDLEQFGDAVAEVMDRRGSGNPEEVRSRMQEDLDSKPARDEEREYERRRVPIPDLHTIRTAHDKLLEQALG